MRTILVLASAAFTAAALAAGAAVADDSINVTPPISREHARAIQARHPAGELTVVPQPVPALAAPRQMTSAAVRLNVADR